MGLVLKVKYHSSQVAAWLELARLNAISRRGLECLSTPILSAYLFTHDSHPTCTQPTPIKCYVFLFS